ncbi:M48 family metalloprotease [Steroidobacter sp. S1-65]|uniref:M48 family metalloprotease n=1 Tax=Steroidobacter gossypii TaxID=2805490 RepID=A0ABS1WQN6_9GAMM|nr:M56 family metallopeptidase [Steroidobacter gossypii]MBM0103292.1 M48 family metalloprotease [Steroidobacter gossypii]
MAAMLALHLWQSTVVLIAAWVLTRLCRRNSAEVRYWIWFCASLKFLVPFALLQQLGDYLGRSLPAPLALDEKLMGTGSAIFVPTLAGVGDLSAHALPGIWKAAVIVWALGAATLLIRWFLQWYAVHASLRRAPELPLDLAVPVRVTAADLTPGVFGVFRPILIVPRSVLRELSEPHLQTILAHEMCHVHRRDNLTAAIHKLVEVMFWFHPLVWWIGANLLREREAACDESVIECGHEQEVYAESILQVCRLGVTAKFAGMSASSGGDLARRMTTIMSNQRVRPIGNARFALLFLMAMSVCYVPVLAGVTAAAAREASSTGRVMFEAITLAPSEAGWWSDAEFDASAGRLSLSNVSFRDLIAKAYPASTVNGDPYLIDRLRYDIEASWQVVPGSTERNVYRNLLRTILRTNSNLQLYVKDGCGAACELIDGELVAGRYSVAL